MSEGDFVSDDSRKRQSSGRRSASNNYGVTYNSWVLSDYVRALRLHTQAVESDQPAKAIEFRRRWYQMAKWSRRLSWFLPPERPRALRELNLVYAHRGRIKQAWKLAARSCRGGEKVQAQYEYAKSLLVTGQLAKELGRPEAESQIREAQAAIERIERSVEVT